MRAPSSQQGCTERKSASSWTISADCSGTSRLWWILRLTGLHVLIQSLGERTKCERGSTKQRVFFPQLRELGEKIGNRFAVRLVAFPSSPSAARDRSPVRRGSPVAIALSRFSCHDPPLIPTRCRSLRQLSLTSSTERSHAARVSRVAATRDVPNLEWDHREPRSRAERRFWCQ
jgi:hypothetical protein